MEFKMEQDTKLLTIEAIKNEFTTVTTDTTVTSLSGGLIYKCEVCARRFSAQVQLDIHKKTHKRNFHLCLSCGKAFATEEFLYIHSQKHSSILNKEQSAAIELYKCFICSKMFSTKQFLETHMTKHEDDGPESKTEMDFNESESNFLHQELTGTVESPYRCSFCEKSFRSKYVLSEHMETHQWQLDQQELKKEAVSCHVCAKSFASQTELLSHCEAQEHRVPCSKVCDTNDEFVSHLETHEISVGGDLNPYKCSTCSETFQFIRCYTIHVRDHHRGALHTCRRCKMCFLTARHLSEHRQSQQCRKQTQPKLPYKCDKCHARYSTQRALNGHKGSHGYHKCMYCAMSCNTFDDLVSHLNTHAERAQEMPCKCSVCEEEFVNKEVMEIHHQKHIFFKGGTLTHKCLTCGERFATAKSLKGHFNVHRFDKKLKCYLCTLSCSTHEELVLHMKSHGKGLPESKDKTLPFKCESCGNRFHSRNALIGHRRVHDLYKHKAVNHKCSFCDKQFVSEQNLANHVKQHVTEKQKDSYDQQFVFPCNVCGQCFHTDRALTRHKGVHSRMRKIIHSSTVGEKEFINEQALEIHYKEHIDKKQNDTKARQSPVTCITCGRSFHNRYALSAHTGHGCGTVLSMNRTQRTKHL